MSEPKSLDSILENFITSTDGAPDPARRRPLTIWISPELKERYDKIQRNSSKRFGDKLRELIQAAIERCDTEDARAS